MKRTVLLVIVVATSVYASERGSLDFGFGGGGWLPGLTESDSELEAGPAISLSLEIPMDQGNIIFLRSGYRTVNTDRVGYESVSAVPLLIGYRTYPFYKPYAGSRGLEPLIGAYGGGMLTWDSVVDDTLETTTTGAGVLGLELGARVKVSENAAVDVVICPEWVPFGGEVAGEEKQALSGLVIYAGVIF
jgi:hypothetical protein